MSGWGSMADRGAAYLEARRAMGYQLRIEGEQLQRFARFADRQDHHGPLTLDLAVDWASQSHTASGIGRARRLEVIRPMARYCALYEPETQIPPPNLLGPGHRRVAPHIYSEREVSDMLDTARNLRPEGGLRPATMRCLIGLLTATGLRISEALALNRDDVDLEHSLLRVRQTKFRKSRYAPVHPTARDALADYAHFRDRRVPLAQDTAFLLFDNGLAVNGAQARYAFSLIRSDLGWDKLMHGRRPRLYDLRHTFTCWRLQAWYQEGRDVNCLMPGLATYLGHAKVTDTYWYLTGTTELLAVAAERFEHLSQQPAGKLS
jgi:integrase